MDSQESRTFEAFYAPLDGWYQVHAVPAGELERLEPLREAYEFAAECHEGQLRKTGDPYITHPVAVTFLAMRELVKRREGAIEQAQPWGPILVRPTTVEERGGLAADVLAAVPIDESLESFG